MRFAYADPPYLEQGKRHYGTHHENAADCDSIDWHAALIDRLMSEFPDGWVLSLNSPSLRHILPLCPEDARVGAWVKPFASFKPNVPIAYAWEPFIFRGGRKRTRREPTVRDWVSANITLKRGLTGAKPEAFCFHIFELLNIRDGDEFVDLFPGTGAVTDAYEHWRRDLLRGAA